MDKLKDQIHEALLTLEHRVPDLINDVLQIDDPNGVDELRDTLDHLFDDIHRAIDRLANGDFDDVPATKQGELAL
jgi:hypothetical protein